MPKLVILCLTNSPKCVACASASNYEAHPAFAEIL